MARLWYGGTPADFATEIVEVSTTDVFGVVADPVVFDVHDAASAGSAVTDLLDASATPMTTVTTDSVGNVPRFQGPDGYEGDLWLSVSAGTRYRLSPSPETLFTRVGTLEAGSGTVALVDLTDVNISEPIEDGAAVLWDDTEGEWVAAVPESAASVADDLNTHEAEGHAYMLRGVVLESGEEVPGDLPTDALVFVLEAGTFGYSTALPVATGAAVTSRVITLTAPIAAGTLVVVGGVWGATDTTATVSDSSSNTWSDATSRLYQSTTTAVQMFYSRITVPLGTGDTITLTMSASTGHVCFGGVTILGSNATPLDKTSSNGQGSTLSPTTNATATLADQPQVAVAVFGYNPDGRSFAAGSGFTVVASGATAARYIALMVKQVSTTDAVTATGTITGTASVTAFQVATFRAA